MQNFIRNTILKLHKQQIIDTIKKGKKPPQDICLQWKDDKDVMLTAITQDPFILYWVSQRLKKDKDIVLAAVRQQGELLMYSSNLLKNDDEVVSEAIKNNALALVYASEYQQNQLTHLRLIKSQADKFNEDYSDWYKGRMLALDILEEEAWMKSNMPIAPSIHKPRKF